MRPFVAIALMLVSLSGIQLQLKAETSETTQYLMNDPASLMDIGVLRLELFADSVFVGDSLSSGVFYEFDSNRIVMRLIDLNGAQDPQQAKARAKLHINRIKRRLGFDEKGQLDPDRSVSLVVEFFEHRGYSREKRPKHVNANIDSMVILEALVMVKGKSTITCESRLVETTVLCSD